MSWPAGFNPPRPPMDPAAANTAPPAFAAPPPGGAPQQPAVVNGGPGGGAAFQAAPPQANGPMTFAPIRPAGGGGAGGALPPPPPMVGQTYQKPGLQQPPPPPPSMVDSQQTQMAPGFPPQMMANSLPAAAGGVGARPSELPVPFHGQAQYSHQLHEHAPRLTPNSSEPPSQKSSRAPSPIPGPTYDALEGQFTPSPGTQRRPLPAGYMSPGAQLARQNTPPQRQSPLQQPANRHSPLVQQPPGPAPPGPPGGGPMGGPAATSQAGFPPRMPPVGGVPPQRFGAQPGFPGQMQPPNARPGFPTPAQPPSLQPAFRPPSQPGFPRTSQPGLPPPSQPGFPPASQPAFPPASQPGFPPPSQPGFPPTSQPGFPPASQPGFPPPSQPGFPPTSQPGYPPASQHGFLPPSQPGFPPPSQPGFPPTSQPGFPPASQPGFPPPSQPGFPPTSQPGYPPASQHGFLPPSQPGFPPTSQPGFPPTSQPGFPPASQPGLPPTSQPGFPPLTRPGFPPPPQPGGFPPPMVPSQVAGGRPPLAPPPTSDMTSQSADVTGKRHYPQMPGQAALPPADGLPAGPTPGQHQMAPPATGQFGGGVNNVAGNFEHMRLQATDHRHLNLLQEKDVLNAACDPVVPNLPADLRSVNCPPDLFSCTLTTLPQTQALLKKSRLPLGILIHPFKDLSHLPVIQPGVIVRCRSCRTYINPFVVFVDSHRWKCNLCFRNNELPEQFSWDPRSKTYGDPQRRPEIQSATVEFIAPTEYMLRPPQAAVYLFVIEVSFNAIETGYLPLFCRTLQAELDRLPGDSRMQIGIVTYDSSLHFYNLAEGLSQPQMLIVSDVDDVFLPTPDSLLVNMTESRELVYDLLDRLPAMFEGQRDTGSALGPALQAAYKLMCATGGRITVFQTQLPTVGPGSLQCREDPNERAGKKVQNLGPATDFYKKLALECSAQQIAVDLFLMNAQYADIASIACVSKYSGGCLHYYPSLHTLSNATEAQRFESALRRYINRKIGFESVMRIRCTRGLAIHTFHGNFFVRSPDLLSLPNINPDSSFGMQLTIEDNLEGTIACCQAALLYTSSKGERRIRVHTMCQPISSQLDEVLAGANQQNIVSFLAKMAVDRSLTSSLGDAREALINAAVDMLGSYGGTLTPAQRLGQLPCPRQLCLIPLYVLALLKSRAFRIGTSTKLDERVFALEQLKTQPVGALLRSVYPDLYPLHLMQDKVSGDGGEPDWPTPVRLSSSQLDRHGAYLLDSGPSLLLWLGAAISDAFCVDVFDLPNFAALPDGQLELPEENNVTSERIRKFIDHLNAEKPYPVPVQVIREDSRWRHEFLEFLIEDRSESTFSYYEFLQHLQKELQS